MKSNTTLFSKEDVLDLADAEYVWTKTGAGLYTIFRRTDLYNMTPFIAVSVGYEFNDHKVPELMGTLCDLFQDKDYTAGLKIKRNPTPKEEA